MFFHMYKFLNSFEEYKSGNDKVGRFLMGQCMKQLKGKADPGSVNKAITEALSKLK